MRYKILEKINRILLDVFIPAKEPELDLNQEYRIEKI
jgi:hypothetical protein